MAARTDGENVPVFGQFHQKYGKGVVLSEGRRVASGGSPLGPLLIAFSNDPIPKGDQFSVKVLQEGKGYVSLPFRRLAVCSVCPAWIAHTRQQSTRNSSRVVRCR